MDIRVLRYFVTVAREGSITGAAKYLHVTQPTLSRQLKELEEELGKKLFIRSSYSVRLTDEGMMLRKRAEDILDLVDKTKAEFLNLDDISGGDINIGGAESETMKYIAQVAKSLQTRYPGIRYHMYSGNADDVAERLDKGLLDFGVFVNPVDLSKYNHLPLPVEEVWGLILPREHPLAMKDGITVDELAGLPLICSRRVVDPSSRNPFLAWFGDKQDALHIVGTYNLIFNAAIMVREGVGCAVGFDKLVDSSSLDGLCFRPFQPAITSGLSIAWKKYHIPSPVVKLFLEEIEKRFSNDG